MMPVYIRGVVYPSQAAAARTLGVSASAIWRRLENGTLDDIGLAQVRKPVTLNGVEYSSMTAASKATGRSMRSIRKAMRKGRTTIHKDYGRRTKVDGVEFPSIGLAASSIGVHRATLERHNRQNGYAPIFTYKGHRIEFGDL